MLVSRGVLTESQLTEALQRQSETRLRLGEVLVEYGFTTDEAIAECLASQYFFPLVDPDLIEPSPDALAFIDAEYAVTREILPYGCSDTMLHCMIADPLDVMRNDELETRAKRHLNLAIAPLGALRRAIRAAYRLPEPIKPPVPTPIVQKKGRRKLESQADREALLTMLMAEHEDATA